MPYTRHVLWTNYTPESQLPSSTLAYTVVVQPTIRDVVDGVMAEVSGGVAPAQWRPLVNYDETIRLDDFIAIDQTLQDHFSFKRKTSAVGCREIDLAVTLERLTIIEHTYIVLFAIWKIYDIMKLEMTMVRKAEDSFCGVQYQIAFILYYYYYIDSIYTHLDRDAASYHASVHHKGDAITIKPLEARGPAAGTVSLLPYRRPHGLGSAWRWTGFSATWKTGKVRKFDLWSGKVFTVTDCVIKGL